jgi:hypothetical protein
MHMDHFGDSYDIVKQSLICWLSHFGDWSVHPMFTEKAKPEKIAKFQHFLRARVISKEVLTPKTDRDQYFSRARKCGHLFLDPDTGLMLDRARGNSIRHLFADEFVRIVECRRDALTLVFDQSFSRCKERERKDCMRRKLDKLAKGGILSFAYVSHECFIVCGRDRKLVSSAYRSVVKESQLPSNRFVSYFRK